MDIIVSKKLLKEVILFIKKTDCNCINKLDFFNVTIINRNKRICPRCKLVNKMEEKIQKTKNELYK